MRSLFFIFLISVSCLFSADPYQEFKEEENKRRELFFANKARLLDPLSSILNKKDSFALPLRKQIYRDENGFVLYANQFYRFLIQSKTPLSHLVVNVYKDKQLVHTEALSLPLKQTMEWYQYLINDGMVHIPTSPLKTKYGLDLRLSFIPDPSCHALVLSQKGGDSSYRFSIGLKGDEPLYESRLIPPPPWQLEALRKPSLPLFSRVLPPSTPSQPTLSLSEDNLKNGKELPPSEILDRFVEEKKKDPLALAQHVLNEIALVDPFLHREDKVLYAPSIHRSAEATFLDKQGSPWEQCMLLIYLLRKAGYQATYAYGPLCSLPKTFVEKMLFIQLEEDEKAQLKYPWVQCFDGKEWISLFPWMKEIEVTEGYDLYTLLPDEYASADRFIKRYLSNDPAILKHIGPDGDDTLAPLFVRFVQEALENKGLSLSDVGIERKQIKKQCTAWEDFPTPEVSEKPQIFTTCKDLNIFASFRASLPIGANTSLAFKILPYDSRLTRSCFFSPNGTFYFGEGGFCQAPSGASYADVLIQYSAPIGKTDSFKVKKMFRIFRGATTSICIDWGCGNPNATMLFHNKFQASKTAVLKDPIAAQLPKHLRDRLESPKEVLEQIHEDSPMQTLLGFVGAVYFQKCARSQRILAKLHKLSPRIPVSFGMTQIQQKNGGTSPIVDMYSIYYPPSSFSSNQDHLYLARQYLALFAIDQSANEHQTLNELFKDSDSVSTVKLLQLIHKKHQETATPDFLPFTSQSITKADNNPQEAKDLYFSQMQNLDLSELKKKLAWEWGHLKSLLDPNNKQSAYGYGYLTPNLTSPNNSPNAYSGSGCFIIHPNAWHTLISQDGNWINGGFGSPLPKDFLELPSLQHYNHPIPNHSSIQASAPPVLPSQFTAAFVPLIPKRTIPSAFNHSNIQPIDYLFFNSQPISSPNPLIPREKTPHSPPLPAFLESYRPPSYRELLSTSLASQYPTPYKKIPSSESVTSTTTFADTRPQSKPFSGVIGDPVDVVTGAFYIDEVDLVLPGPFPLEIRRNYSSQSPLKSFFGHGWKLGLNPVLMKHEDKLYAAEMDGTLIAYELNKKNNRWEVFPENNPDLCNFNTKGIGGTANLFNNYIENDVLYGADGSKRVFKEELLQKWTDERGNSLTLFYKDKRLEKIENSSGYSCGFYYDYNGYISEIYTVDGRRVHYRYTSCGDLAEVILPNNAHHSYEYNDSHQVIREIKPYGHILENSYDEAGRVIEQRSPVGPKDTMETSATFTFDENLVKVTSGKGHTTTYHIFDNQIYKIIDPEGNTTLQSWFIDKKRWFDAKTGEIKPWEGPGGYPKSLKSFIDKRGLVTSYLYDNNGNVQKVSTEGKDLTGSNETLVTKTQVYNSNNLCTEEKQGSKKILTTYDKTLPYLKAKVEVYFNDTLSTFSHFSYTSKGLLKTENHSGSITHYDYNTQGFPIKKTEETGTQDPDVITHYRSNRKGQCIKKITSTHTQKWQYDIMGSPLSSLTYSPDGTLIAATYCSYDYENRPIWKQTENSNNTLHIDYNAFGKIKAKRQSITPSGETAYTLYEYDVENNLIEEVDPLGHVTSHQYDALGQVTATTKNGVTHQFTYEPGGKLHCSVAPSGAKTTHLYTTNGLLKETLLPDGTKNSTIYDPFGRPIQKTENGITYAIAYDDPAKQVTRTHLESQTQTTETFDSRGNLIAFKDESGALWENTYDSLDRVTSKRTPTGETTTWNYVKNQTICTRPNGEKEIKHYHGDRVEKIEIFDPKGTLISLTTNHYDPKTDTQTTTAGPSTTTTTFNTLGLPLKIAAADNTTTYEYDLMGNRTATIDGENRKTQYRFDPLQRLIKKTLPNGEVFRYKYDNDSNLIGYRLPDKTTWKATYDFLGKRTSTILKTKEGTARHFQYTYKKGRLTQVIDPLNRIRNYTYNSHGKLIAETLDEWSRFYHYDPCGRLTEAKQTSANSSTSLVSRTYDPSGRITSETVTLNSKRIAETHQAWTPTSRSLTTNSHQRHFTYQNQQLTHLSSSTVDLQYVYDHANNLTQLTTPVSATQTTYTPASLPQNRRLTLLDTSQEETLQWDRSGKLLQLACDQTTTFTYHPNGHLQSISDEPYTFNAMGLCIESPTSYIPEEGLDPFGRVIQEIYKDTPVTTTYDSLGQTLSQNTRTYQWDPWGQLITINDPNYSWKATYDALGRRIQTHFNPRKGSPQITTSFYDPQTEFQEIGVQINSNTFWKYFGPISCDAITDDTQTFYLSHNVLGHLIAITSTEQTTPLTTTLFPYGPKTIPPPQDLLSYAYTLSWKSASLDPTGLILLGKRYYQPTSKRFLSPDPIDYPTSPHLYTYANNDPINYHDPDGRYAAKTLQTFGTPPVVNTANIISTILANYDLTRSGNFEIGSGDLERGALLFINGIDNKKHEFIESALMVSQYAQGAKVYGTYNATNSPPVDVFECVLGRMGIRTPPSQHLKNKWNDLVSSHRPDEKFLQICHSGGAQHVKHALETSSKSMRQRIIVLAISPAVIIPNELCFRSDNYMSKRDFVTRLDVLGQIKYGNELHVLEPHPDADDFDHAFNSPTFQKTLDFHITNYKKNYGGID